MQSYTTAQVKFITCNMHDSGYKNIFVKNQKLNIKFC